MCRITAIKGPISENSRLIEYVSELQQYGGTIKAEIYHGDDVTIILDRFDITSSSLEGGVFPLEDENYVLAFNGEVYSYQDIFFNKSDYISDAHFALYYINQIGHKEFFKESDYEGTFIVYQKSDKKLFVYTDQLNSKGCFYSDFSGNFIVTQEISVLNQLLSFCDASEKTAIKTLGRANFLCVESDFTLKKSSINPVAKKIWQGDETSSLSSSDVNLLYTSLKKSLESRIPKTGQFGALCSGGVDSSIIIKMVVDHLMSTEGNVDRLHVFTMGKEFGASDDESNDLKYAKVLIENINKEYNCQIILEQIYPENTWIEYLLKNEVLSDNPHLITPNPVQTQVRHTVMMSVILAQIVLKHPDIKVVITGDFADEIFGGYNSMHDGSFDNLRNNIYQKLDDLNLNDASRVTLASLRGCKYLLDSLQDGKLATEIENIVPHPMEVRTPYLSYHVSKTLEKMPTKALVGTCKGKTHSKYILRVLASFIKIPDEIAFRKKIPFNEGGTGAKNSLKNELEEKIAEQYLKENNPSTFLIDLKYMTQIGIKKYDAHNSSQYFEEALYFSASKAGLQRFIKGGAFKNKMPDSNYSTETKFEELYLDIDLIEFKQ